MILLTATTHALELQTLSASSTDWTCSYVDMTSTDTTLGSNQGNVASITTTTIAAAPAASTQRQIKQITVTNNNTASQSIKIKKDVSGTEYVVFCATLQSNQTAQYLDGQGWSTFDSEGREKIIQPEIVSTTGVRPRHYYKTGTAAEGSGYWYCFAKDNGYPGAWSPGTPGTDGRTTDGTTAADAGCIPIWTPTGSLYLEQVNQVATTSTSIVTWDILWVNTALSVTTTTAQTIASFPTLPARDDNGTTNGDGCMVGILFTAASTNAGTITNSTISYTNSAGTSGRTGTLDTNTGDIIPATPVVGTVVWFQLAAGDLGVRSVQSITLATSLVSGSISLIVARAIAGHGIPAANVGFDNVYNAPGLRIWNGSCLHVMQKAIGSGATTVHGFYQFSER